MRDMQNRTLSIRASVAHSTDVVSFLIFAFRRAEKSSARYLAKGSFTLGHFWSDDPRFTKRFVRLFIQSVLQFRDRAMILHEEARKGFHLKRRV